MADRMKILVAYDGSECADAALDDLRRAGLHSDAQIKVLSVVENWLPPPSGVDHRAHRQGSGVSGAGAAWRYTTGFDGAGMGPEV